MNRQRKESYFPPLIMLYSPKFSAVPNLKDIRFVAYSDNKGSLIPLQTLWSPTECDQYPHLPSAH